MKAFLTVARGAPRRWRVPAIIAAMLFAAAGCSTFTRNELADVCANQQTALANAPLGVLTQAQAAELLAGLCAGTFGTVAAPTPAPGMAAVIPGPTPAPSPAAAATAAGRSN